MGLFGNGINRDNDEILFFILVFLLLFNGNFFGFGDSCDEAGGYDNGTILFFIILFLLLFFGNGYTRDEKC